MIISSGIIECLTIHVLVDFNKIMLFNSYHVMLIDSYYFVLVSKAYIFTLVVLRYPTFE